MSEIDRRQYARRPATYALDISSEAADGAKVSSVGTLHDISDSGISFSSNRSELFQIGQKVEIVLLSNSQATASHMLHATGEIMWLEPSQFEVNQALIGLCLEGLIESESIISNSQ